MSDRLTQTDRLLAYLRSGNRATPLNAWADLGIYRLGARVWDLRKRLNGSGETVMSKLVPVPNCWGETCHVKAYWLELERGNG